MNIVVNKAVMGMMVCVAGTGVAFALQEQLFEGVWVSDAKFCPLMEKIGTRAIFGNDIVIMTPKRGFVGFEFFCSFDEFAYGSDGKSIVISATCDDPGESFPETIYLDRYQSERIDAPLRFEFNSEYITGQKRPGDGDEDSRFLFSRCDNLSEQLLIERSEP